MKFFFDTSVLVAVAVSHHTHHRAGFAAFRQVMNGRHRGVVAAHGLAETYSVLTRLPLSPMIRPAEALRFLKETVLRHCEVVSLQSKDYTNLIESSANEGVRGGAVYDRLQLQSAEKAHCDRIYTFNLSDFLRLAPHLQTKIASP